MSINIRLIVLYTLVNAEIKPPVGSHNDLLEDYLNTKIVTVDTYVAIGVIGTKPEIAEWFLRKQVNYSVMIWNEKRAEVPDYPTFRTKNLVGFIADVKEFKEYLKYLDDCTFLHRRGNFHFIVGEHVADDAWLRDICERIWIKYKILNFVLVFVMSDALQIASYNPFSDSVYYLNETSAFFPRKLRNMHGFKLKTSMFEIIPITWKEDGRFHGEDIFILEHITRSMRATYEVIDAFNFSNAKRMVKDEEVDFSFVKFVVLSEVHDLGYSYPINLEPIVVIVPKSKMLPPYLYILYIFTPIAWSCICLAGGTFYLFKYAPSIVPGKVFSHCIVLMMWMTFVLIIPSAFTSGLASVLTKPKFTKNIDSLAELVDSEYNIVTSPYIYSILGPKLPDLKHKFIELSQVECAARVSRGETDTAFAGTYAVINKLLSNLADRGLNPYHMLEEQILPGHTSYAFPFRSPFSDEIINRILYLHQYFSNTVQLKSSRVTQEPITLSIVHLHFNFILLFIGCSLGFIVYTFEVIVFNWKKICNVQIDIPND